MNRGERGGLQWASKLRPVYIDGDVMGAEEFASANEQV